MPVSCIVALEKDSIIRHAVTNLVNLSDSGLIIRQSQAANIDELINEISFYGEDVILIVASNAHTEESLLRLLMACPRLLILVVNENSNWVHVFQRDDKLLSSASDLLDVIHSGLSRLFQESWREF